MRIKVYSKCLELIYINTFFSKATFSILILSTIKYVVPFIIAYQSKGTFKIFVEEILIFVCCRILVKEGFVL